MIFGKRVGLGADGAGAVGAAERAHAAHHHLRLLARQQRHIVLHRNQRAAAHHHRARLGEVQRHDRDVFLVDVVPDVQLGPVGKREDADALAFIDAAVVEVPEFGTLILGVPLAEGVAEGVDTLLGARFLFVAACAAEGRVEVARGEARRAGRASSADRSTSGCRGGTGWRHRRSPADWCGRSVWRRFPRRSGRGTRSSRWNL